MSQFSNGPARPVRPEQREHAAALDPQVDPGKHAHVAAGPDQSARLDRQLTAHLPGPGGPRHVHDAPRLSSSAYSLRIIAQAIRSTKMLSTTAAGRGRGNGRLQRRYGPNERRG